jgi:hypothetical protein
MLRFIATVTVLPFLLAVLLALTMDMLGGKMGSLSRETFELGLLPVALLVLLVMLGVFVPLLLLTSRFAKLTPWSTSAAGLVSALLPVLLSVNWSGLVDSRLRLSFRTEQFVSTLAGGYPWLAMGAAGGLLFWLFAILRNPAVGQRYGGPT